MKIYKRYNNYKKSGFEWLGEIPSHWEDSTVKALTRVVSRKNRPNEPLLSVYRDYGVILKSSRDDNYNRPGQDLSAYKYVQPTNLVLNKMKTWQGSLGVSEFHGIVSPAYITCEIDLSNVFPRYLHYLLRCRNYIHEYNRLSYGVRTNQWDMRYDDFKKIPVFLPSNQEQRAIASFLNHKTAEIDHFVANEEKLIALLNAQKASIINRVVTRGLTPNEQMKPSGVEWIGEIPKHWEVLKVKYVGSSKPSKNNPKTNYLKGELVVFLPMERVHTDGTIDQELRHPYSQLKNGYTYFEENDVLIAKVTPCFENGKIVLIKNLETPVGFASTEFIVIRPNLQKVFPPFLYYILYNVPLRNIGKHFMTSAVGLKRLPTGFVENFRIPIPTYHEQTQIANFLDHETKQINELISKESQKIELIKKYRQALISQAVTGKINVRDSVINPP